MSRFAFSVILLFFLLFSIVKNDTNARIKRAEIDLQTCIDNFNVHKDKIIRTQDSQNMGAKYLNEMDLGSREECLRLCCETEECDVFVFEEKNAGSCYLFHCGPPEDFKCKFTHHANYSSAVLSVNRHLPDLESQIKLTKHQQDLSKLRKPEVTENDPKLIPSVQEMKTTTTLSPILNKEVIPSENQVKQTRKCSRYQFECRSTGECIAIYNACDGIPQCADASDEAPELGCPSPEAVAGVAGITIATTPPPTPPRKVVLPLPPAELASRFRQQLPQGFSNEEPVIQQQANKPNIPITNIQPVYLAPPPNSPADLSHFAPAVPPQISQEPDFLRPVVDHRNPGRVQYEPVPPVQQYVPQIDVTGQNGWIPRPQQNNVPQMQMPVYSDESRAYRKNLNLDPENTAQVQYPEPLNSRGYQKATNYYGENYRQPVQQENWPLEGNRYRPDQPKYAPDNNPPLQLEKEHHHVSPYKDTETRPVKYGEKSFQSEVNPEHVQEKLAHDLKQSKENMEHANSSTTVRKPSPKTSHHHEKYPDVVAVKLTGDDTEDGLSQVPRGAILSLALGLIITAVMAILIGCRLRVVRRKLRRGGKYAHDADFLVNGMYL